MSIHKQTPTVEELWNLVQKQQAEIEHLRSRRRLASLVPGRKMLMGMSLLAALAVNGNAFAAIPDTAGVITGCYLPASGIVRIIDTSVASCRAGERQINWYSDGAPIAAGTITGVLPISHGGTGSATQNFVDLSNAQTVGGSKTFTDTINGNVHGDVAGNVTGNLKGDVTGNVTGNVSGNAGTVTNGLYNTGSYADPPWLTSLSGSKISGDISGNAAGFNGRLYGDVIGAQGSTRVTGINGIEVTGTPSDGQVLQYNGSSEIWEPQSLPPAYTPSVLVVAKHDEAGIDGGVAFGTVYCPSGYAAISGGIYTQNYDTYVSQSFPAGADGYTTHTIGSENGGWTYKVNNTDPIYTDHVVAYAVCLNLS
jgi:hypothetical protein